LLNWVEWHIMSPTKEMRIVESESVFAHSDGVSRQITNRIIENL